ncbi:MAG: enoyl-CoA hydratase/isomerase family protein [Antricoccus sp.]
MVTSAIDEITVEVRDAVATLTLNREAKRNAMALRMWQEIPNILAQVADDESISAVVLTGAGEHFCAGADISEFGTVRSTSAGAHDYARTVDAAEHAIADLPKPTIAMIRGYCVGGGMEISLACDFRIASESAKMGITASKLGIIYGVPSTWRLASVVGPAWAKYVMFSANIFPADRAQQMGLLTDLVSDEQLETVTSAFAEVLCSRSALSIAASKSIINHYAQVSTLAEPDMSEHTERAVASEFYRSNVAAFNSK